jgi:hypothetical protein
MIFAAKLVYPISFSSSSPGLVNKNRSDFNFAKRSQTVGARTPETELFTNLTIANQPPKSSTRVTTITTQRFVCTCDDIYSSESTLYPISATTRRPTPQWLTESNPMIPTSLRGERKEALVHKQAGIKEQQPYKR